MPEENENMQEMSCALNLENLLAQECGNNQSGVKRVFMAPKTHLTTDNFGRESAPDDFAEFVTLTAPASGKALTPETGRGFMELYSARDLGELKYASQGSVMGNRSLKATLEIVHPSFKRKALGFFGSLLNREWIIIVLLNNGEYHMLGDLDRGAIVADGAEGTSGKAATDQNGLTLTFEWDTAYPQIVADGWKPQQDTGGLPLI